MAKTYRRLLLYGTVLILWYHLVELKRQPREAIPLSKGYWLSYYESVGSDSFLVLKSEANEAIALGGEGEVVVAPRVTKIAFNDRFIWGVVEPNKDHEIFDPNPAGLFMIRVGSGEILRGMSEFEFCKLDSGLSLLDLKPSPSFWKPRWGRYQPR